MNAIANGINGKSAGDNLKKLEKEKGIVIRFVIGHSATKGGLLDKAIDAEDEEHKDFLRLNHVEGYHRLSTKTRLYFSTAVSMWDAQFYVKVDDDVHLNLGTFPPLFLFFCIFHSLVMINKFNVLCFGRYTSEHFGQIPHQTQSLYWMHEVWPSSIS